MSITWVTMLQSKKRARWLRKPCSLWNNDGSCHRRYLLLAIHSINDDEVLKHSLIIYSSYCRPLVLELHERGFPKFTSILGYLLLWDDRLHIGGSCWISSIHCQLDSRVGSASVAWFGSLTWSLYSPPNLWFSTFTNFDSSTRDPDMTWIAFRSSYRCRGFRWCREDVKWYQRLAMVE